MKETIDERKSERQIDTISCVYIHVFRGTCFQCEKMYVCTHTTKVHLSFSSFTLLCDHLPIIIFFTDFADRVHSALVGGQLCLKRLVLLQLALKVGRVSVALVCRHCQLLVNPVSNLQRRGENIGG